MTDSKDIAEIEVLGSEEVSQEQVKVRIRDEYEEKRRRRYGAKRQSQDTKRALIVKMSMQGIGDTTISQAVKLPIKTVTDIRKRFLKEFKELDSVDTFKEVKTDIFEAIQLQALKSAVSPKKLNKSSFLATISGVEKLQKMQRLHDGLSTDNHAHVFGVLKSDENE